MKVVILAGGLGTRLVEETEVRPKPMVEIGGEPILMHIMRIYAHFGHREFVLALGYRGEIIKRYMRDLNEVGRDFSVNTRTGAVEHLGGEGPDWNVQLVDTGRETQTGGRLKRLAAHLRDGTFMLTYGDGVGNVDLAALLRFHRGHGKLATITAVRPPARFGGIEFAGDRVIRFNEKPQVGEGWINGGFMVLEPGVLDYIPGDEHPLEIEPMERLAAEGQLMAYRHEGFWQPMDTLREKRLLEAAWETGRAPWKVW